MIARTEPIRVLHVSEAFGGGLASAVQEYVAATPDYEHSLAYVGRDEAPLGQNDLGGFAHTVSLQGGTLHRLMQLRRFSRVVCPNIVHAHSAYGGVYARIALASQKLPVVYTPHCFPFEREDFSNSARTIFRCIEQLLARRTAVIAACSPREAALGRAITRGVPVVYVPNVSTGETTDASHNGSTTNIVGVGRLTAQKDPAFFVECIKELRSAGIAVEAKWIGDGDDEMRRTLEGAGVAVSGWLTRVQSRKMFTSSGAIYVHTALWEGFPMSILEARNARAPVIVRQAKWYQGITFPLVVDTPSDIIDLVRRMLSAQGRKEASEALDRSLRENNPAIQRARLLVAYDCALATISKAARRSKDCKLGVESAQTRLSGV